MHKYNFGLIGNCSFSALIDLTGNVSWLCWPRFDSNCVFGQLLDPGQGYFYIRPDSTNYKSRQFYQVNSAILCTEFETSSGVFRVHDFAPRFKQFERNYKPLSLHRRIEIVSGAPLVKVGCRPVFNYSREKAKSFLASNHIKYEGSDSQVRLYSSLPLTYIQDEKSFVLQEDETLILTHGTKITESIPQSSLTAYEKTLDYWQHWSSALYLGSFHQEEVIRSAITLKLHQFDDTGAIIAATTTSLPEYPHSERNWDYRYCWIRDSYYTLSALNAVGKFDELKRFSKYLQDILIKSNERIQPLYSVSGESRLDEKILDFEGYQKSGPVRVGNAAYTHIQNDVYGQILLSLLPLFTDARFPQFQKGQPHLGTIKKTLAFIEKLFDEPDAGLWEFRTKVQHHCYTYLFHWTGALAGKKIAEKYGDKELAETATRLAEKAKGYIEDCYDKDSKVYTQATQSKALDASLFQLVTMGYLDPASEKSKHHIDELVKNLSSHENLFFRYRHIDDFGSTHASFLVCAFWYVEALAAMNRVDEAIDLFEKLLPYSNHLGLFSEDVDAKDGSQWGNFPQTYSHVGLINSAHRISQKLVRPSFF